MQKYQKNILLVGVCLLVNGSIFAEEPKQEFTQLSRYVKINVDSELQQRNPLKTIASIRYPNSIQTVGQAITYSLDRSGYAMLNSKGLSKSVRILLSRPLPQIHRQFQFVTLENILKTLAGNAFSLLVDPVSREINFVTVIDY